MAELHAFPAVLTEGGAHADWLARPLVEAGGALRHCTLREVPEQLDSGLFNILVLGRFYTVRHTKGEERAAVQALHEAVQRFLARGGGVFFSLPVEGGILDYRPFLDPFGARILSLGIEQDSHVHAVSSDPQHPGEAAYTTDLHPGFASGVEGVWFPCRGCGPSVATRPVWSESGSGWFPVLRALPDSRTCAESGHWSSTGRADLRGFDRSVPLIQACRIGAGRMAVCGICAAFHVAATHNFPMGRRFLFEGFEGRPSGLRPLLFNLWNWLAEPSAGRLGGATTESAALLPQVPRFPADPPVVWANRDLPRPLKPPIFGLIGARTAHSCGRGTVAEYVDRARSCGLDFLVFLEEFRCLTVEGLESLKAECRSQCTPDFLAIPGYAIDDVAGNHVFQYGPDIVFPEDDMLDPQRERFAPARQAIPRNARMATVHCHFLFRTMDSRCRRGRYRYNDTPLLFEEHRFFDSAGLVTWHDGRILDDQRDRYGRLAAQGMRLIPATITLLDGPEDVQRALAEGWRVGLTEPYDAVSDRVLRKWMAPELEWWGMIDERRMLDPAFRFSNWQYGTPFQFITQGPEIHEWTASVSGRDPTWRAPDTEIPPTADPYRVDVLHFVLRINVSARAGLDRVDLLDGERILRRWRVHGRQTFETELDMLHARQMHLRLEVVDSRGGKAVSSDYTTLRLDWCEFYCADRNNPLKIGFECGPNREAYGWIGTLCLNYGIGPWGGTMPTSAPGRLWRSGDALYPVPCNPVEDESVPADGGIGNPGGGLHVYPLVPGEETPMVRASQRLISPDIAIDDVEMERVFDWNWPWFFGRRNSGFGNFPSAPSRHLAVNRTARVFRPVPGLLTCLEYRYGLRWKTPPPVNKPFVIGWLDGHVRHVLHRKDGSALDLPGLDDRPFTVPWRRGEVLVSRDDCGRPALFLNDGIDLELWRDTESVPGRRDDLTDSRDRRLCLRIEPEALPCELRWFAAGAPASADAPDLAVRYVREMGFDGPPAWPVDVRRGRVLRSRGILELEAQDGAVDVRWTDAPLSAGLPVAVHGLRDNHCAFLVDREAGKWRPLGMLDGVACLSLDPRRSWDLWIGHPLLSDDANLGIDLVPTGEDAWRIEIHNPTESPVHTRIRVAPDFDMLCWDGLERTVPPGASEVVRLPASTGTRVEQHRP